MANRPKISQDVETQLLTLSRRRCAICFGLEGDLSTKRGQIAHLDNNPANNELDNLAFLCFDHHDEYDSSTRQSKGLQIREVKIYREGLYEAVRQYFVHAPTEQPSPEDEFTSILFSQGELDFYLGQYQTNLSESLRLLTQTSELLGLYNNETADRTAQLERLLAAPRLDLRRSNKIDHLGGFQMTSFANKLVALSGPIAVVTSKMLNALTRSSAVASDIESVDRSLFEEKLKELDGVRQILRSTISNASACRNEVATYPRGSTVFNRGKRLVLAAIDEHVQQMSRMLDSIETADSDLQEVLTLL